MHVKVLVDNTTAQNTLNELGTSHSPSFNSLIKTIWDWYITNKVWITVTRIPGKENVDADSLENLHVPLIVAWTKTYFIVLVQS